MWKCKKCGEENENNFEICWNCQTENDGIVFDQPTRSQKTEEEQDFLETQKVYNSSREIEQLLKYDPKIIYEFAARLYNKAYSIIFGYTIIGALIGAIGGFFIGTVAKTLEETFGLLIGLCIGGVIGFSIGNDKAFQYKLQAQLALCQVKIEENTRSLLKNA